MTARVDAYVSAVERWLNARQPSILHDARGWEIAAAARLVRFFGRHVYVACSSYQPNPHLLRQRHYYLTRTRREAAERWAAGQTIAYDQFPDGFGVRVLCVEVPHDFEHVIYVGPRCGICKARFGESCDSALHG